MDKRPSRSYPTTISTGYAAYSESVQGLIMAGDWMKFEANTPEKPEVLAITIELGYEDPDLTVGKLLKVWRWFDQHTVDGNAENVTPALLDRLIGVTGIAKAMEKVGWLKINDDSLTLPNFDYHNGQTAKNRSETAKRVASFRAKGGAKEKNNEEKSTNRAAIPRPIRALIYSRDKHTCVYCDRPEGKYAPPELASDAVLTIDHVIPLSKGGLEDVSNYVTACMSCNQYKSDRTPDECSMNWPIDENGKRIGNKKSVTPALPREEKRREENIYIPPIGAELLKTWMAVRKNKKAGAVSEIAYNALHREAQKAGLTDEQAVTICCERSWTNFNADWVNGDKAKTSNSVFEGAI
jgi:hypothetical protein